MLRILVTRTAQWETRSEPRRQLVLQSNLKTALSAALLEVPLRTGLWQLRTWAVRLCRLSIARGQAQRLSGGARSRGPASASGGPMLAEAPRGQPRGHRPSARLGDASCGPVARCPLKWKQTWRETKKSRQ